jgi:hypothetical protein
MGRLEQPHHQPNLCSIDVIRAARLAFDAASWLQPWVVWLKSSANLWISFRVEQLPS